MKKSTVIISSLAMAIYTQAQPVRHAPNIYYLSAGQYNGEQASPLSFAANPAVIPANKGLSVGMYSEKRFNVAGLNLLSASVVLSHTKSAVGGNIQYFGNPDYNETQIGIHYGRPLGKINIGTSMIYNTLHSRGSAKQAVINTSIGMTWQLSEKIYMGLQFINPHTGWSRRNNKTTSSAYKMGFACLVSEQVNIGLEILKEEDKNPEVIPVLQFRLARQFFSRAGFNTGTSQPFIGAGWSWKDIQLEIIVNHHTHLGATPALLFIYQKNDHTEK